MGRTTEIANHYFVSSINQPTKEGAEALRKTLTDEDDDMVEVFCVRRGIVDWGEVRFRCPNRLLYGQRANPPQNLGHETGYLVRTICQCSSACPPDYDAEKRDKQDSWDDYHALARFLTRSPD